MLESSLWIALGGAIGSVMRFWLAELVGRFVESPFPWATVITNITGSFVIGFYATLTGPEGRLLATPVARQFVMVGICGGYTTFSAFSLETLHRLQAGLWSAAALDVALSTLSWLFAAWLGFALAARLDPARRHPPPGQ